MPLLARCRWCWPALPLVRESRRCCPRGRPAGDDRVIVPALVNDLADDSERLVLVIDDYHLINDITVHRGIERLIELSPAQLTTVVSTRVDPPFRLGRMRVRNRVSEVRAHELRFAVGEAADLLGSVGEQLTATAIDDLCVRTEGWAAGLVLAGLSSRPGSCRRSEVTTNWWSATWAMSCSRRWTPTTAGGCWRHPCSIGSTAR